MFYKAFIKLCEQYGVRPSNVAEAIGANKSSATGWKKGSVPTDTTLLKIANYFGVDPSVFKEEASPDAVRVPVLGSVPAGIPLEAIEDITDYEEIPKAMLSGGKEYFALKVKGDSMFPVFLDGDTVIVRKSPTCQSGEVCVVYVNGNDATLKEVRIDERKNLSLIPRNTNYSPRTFTAAEVEELPVVIAGVVVELRRKFR